MHHMCLNLSEHLAKHPAGFSRPTGGYEIEMLKKRFTEDEVEITCTAPL